MNKVSNDSGRLYRLDAKNREVEQPVQRDVSEPENFKFVETDLVRIANPESLPLRFDVHFENDRQERVFLGTFSPYPSDNPGTFIVPTQGRLRAGGKLILSMVLPDGARDSDKLYVEVREMKIRRE